MEYILTQVPFKGNLVTYSKWPSFHFVVFSWLFCSVETDFWVCSNDFLSLLMQQIDSIWYQYFEFWKAELFFDMEVTGESDFLVSCVYLRVLLIID